MASTKRQITKPHITADVAMAGILALLADERDARIKDDKGATKTEVLLSGAGLSGPEIQAVTGKTSDAIAKALQRSRKTPSRRGGS